MEITPEFVSVVPLDGGSDGNLYSEICFKDDGTSGYQQCQFTCVERLENTTDGSISIVYEHDIPEPYDGIGKLNRNIKKEVVEEDVENATADAGATDDESMAVEALRQLGNTAVYTPPRIETKTPKDLPLLPCPHCNLLFRTTADLQYHTSVCRHNQLLCQICNKAFDRKIDLNNHLVCHAVDRPHSCRLCGTLFLHKKDLLKHLPVHQEDVNVNQCSVCGVIFNRPSSLTNHMKIHNYQPGREMFKVEACEINSNATQDVESETNNTAENNTTKIVLPSISQMGTLNNWELGTYDTLHAEPYNTYVNLEVGQEMTIGNFEEDKVNIVSINYDPIAEETNNLHPPEKETTATPVSQQKRETTVNATTHDVTSKNKKPHVCKYCSKTFAREKALMSHLKLHKNILESFLQCDTCDQCFEDENTLDKHLLQCNRKMKNIVLSNETQEQPPERSKIIIEEKQLQERPPPLPRITLDENARAKFYKHICSVCQKAFSTKQKLYRHMWIHRKKTYGCEICASTFDKQEDLDLHRLSSHQGCSAYLCNECGKSFISRQGLWEHSRIHGTTASLYQCTECSKTFSSRQGYLIHKRTHNDERPYGCRYCLKSFRDGGTLRKHERIHTGERPHACPLCSRTFNQKVVLREHVRWLHTANKQPNEDGKFNCLLCDHIMTDKDELCAHIVKHSDQLALLAKNASSNNVSEATRSNLVINRLNESGISKVKTEIVPLVTVERSSLNCFPNDQCHECDICNSGFLSKEELMEHVRIHI